MKKNKANIKRVVSMLLAVCLYVNILSLPVGAALSAISEKESVIMFSETQSQEQLCQEISSIEAYFTKDEVLAFADYHKNTYLEGKIAGNDVTVGEEMIPMYGIKDELAAWYVPYLYEDGGVAGYIIIGSNMDSYNFYGIIERPEDYYTAKQLCEEGRELVFLLPKQEWFTNDKNRQRGCGTVAAANITAYLSRYKAGMSNLYTAGSKTSITRAQFLTHMNSVARYVKPDEVFPMIGVLPTKFTSSVMDYANSQQVRLQLDKYYLSSELWDFFKASNYIIQSLNDNRPVAICIFGSNGFADSNEFTWHWMTVTKYFQNSSDLRWVAFSSWGRRYSVNWRLMHNYQYGVQSGVGNRVISFKLA